MFEPGGPIELVGSGVKMCGVMIVVHALELLKPDNRRDCGIGSFLQEDQLFERQRARISPASD